MHGFDTLRLTEAVHILHQSQLLSALILFNESLHFQVAFLLLDAAGRTRAATGRGLFQR